MEMCRSFFLGFAEIQKGRHGSISIFLRLQKLKVVNYSDLQSHTPQYGDVHVILPRFYGNSKWPPCMKYTIFCGRRNSKIEVRNNVQVILLKFKMATTSRLFKYLCPQKL